jgi:hypothetical protein
MSACCLQRIQCIINATIRHSASTLLVPMNVSVLEWERTSRRCRKPRTMLFGPWWPVKFADHGSDPLMRPVARRVPDARPRSNVVTIEHTARGKRRPCAMPAFGVLVIPAVAYTRIPAPTMPFASARACRPNIPTMNATAPRVSWAMVTNAKPMMRNPNPRSNLTERLRRTLPKRTNSTAIALFHKSMYAMGFLPVKVCTGMQQQRHLIVQRVTVHSNKWRRRKASDLYRLSGESPQVRL